MPWGRRRYSSYSYDRSVAYGNATNPHVGHSYPETERGLLYKHFASPALFADWAEERGAGHNSNLRHYHGNGQSGPSDVLEGLRLLREGDASYVHEAEAMMSKLQETVPAPTFKWEHNLAGAFPDVPAYLADDPEHMWYRRERTDDRTPLRIWVNTSCSWTISAASLRTRGIILAAFALAMQNIRPVIITPFGNGHSYDLQEHAIISYDVQTSPFIMSQLMPVLSDVHVVRYLWITSIFMVNSHIGSSVPFANVKREHLEKAGMPIKPTDMYIEGITPGDVMLNSPIEWLQNQIQLHMEEISEATY